MKRILLAACLAGCALGLGAQTVLAESVKVPVNKISSEGVGEAIGFVKLRPLQSRGTHEIVYAIGEESLWGRGYGKGAVRSALSAAFLDSRAERVIARIDPENTRSIRSVCACGFSRCGKEGKLHLYDLTQERYLENLRASYAQKRAEG